MSTPGASRSPSSIAWVAAGIVWLALVAGGTCLMLDYSESAGVALQPPASWPPASQLQPSPDRPNLIMFVHPRCPCSRASMNELDRLVARVQDRVKIQVLFVKPPGADLAWVKEGLFELAQRIPHVQVTVDDEGREAARFNAATSGLALLYDQHGTLLFGGGITPARGHAGDSAGRAAILGILEQHTPGKFETPVFGCELCEGGKS